MFRLLCLFLLVPALTWGACTQAQLNTEFTTDPSVPPLGYSAFVAAGNDQGVLDLFNLPRAGAAFRQTRGLVQSWEVIGATNDAEFEALTGIQLQRLTALLAGGQVNFQAQAVRDGFNRLFPAATAPTSRAAIIALATRQGSRAEALCGQGFTATLRDISLALHNTQ